MGTSKAKRMVKAFLYDAAGHDKVVELSEKLLSGLGHQQLIWIDFKRTDDAALAEVAELLGLPAEGLEALKSSPRQSQQVSKIIFSSVLLALPRARAKAAAGSTTSCPSNGCLPCARVMSPISKRSVNKTAENR